MKIVISTFAALNLVQFVAAKETLQLTEQAKIAAPEVSSTLNSDSEKDTSAKSKVPAGFEGLNNNYDGKVKLLDNYSSIGEASVFYNEDADSITLSKQAQQEIIEYYDHNLTKKGKIKLVNTLKHAMPAKTTLNKFYEAQSDDKITCYFNYNKLSLNILIPNQYLKNHSIQYKYNLYHPNPTFLSPAFKSSLYTYYNHYSNYDKTKWEAVGSAAYGRNSLIYSVNNTLTDHVNDLYLEHHSKKYTYDLGYKEPSFSSVVNPYGNVWGVFITENPKLINNKFVSAYKSPLTITTTKPYYVEIKSRGRILYRGTLLQGENVIDTSGFPQGTYNITISKRDLATNEIKETTEIFSQQGSKYNWIHSGIAIVAGLESDYFKSAFTDKNLYFHAQKGYSLLEGEGDIFYTFANDTSYIGAEYDYISSNNFDYSISASISQEAYLYFSAISSYINGKSSYSANIYSGFSDDFSSNRQQYARLQYSYSEKDWQFSASGHYDFADNPSLSSSIYKTLTLSNIPTRASATLHYNNNSFTYLLGLSISFDIDKHITSSTTLDHSSSTDHYSISNTTSYNNKESNLKLSNTLYLGLDGNNYNLTSTSYDTDIANYRADLNVNTGDEGTSINTASISMRTNFYLTPSAYVFSKTDADQAYLVTTPTITDDPNTKFLVSNKTASQGETILVPSSSFKYQTLNITPENMEYRLKQEHWNEFFYPGNIYTPNTEIEKACLVSFYADIPADYNYTFAGMEDEFYGHGQRKTTAQMADGTKFTYIYLNDNNRKCETDVVVKCNKKHIDLGKVSCKESKE